MSRLKIDDNEASFEVVERAVRRHVLEDPNIPDETKSRLAEALEDADPALSAETRLAVEDALLHKARSERFLRAVHAALREVADRDGLEIFSGGDFWIVSSEQARVVVTAKYLEDGTRITTRSLALSVQSLLRVADERARFIVVTNALVLSPGGSPRRAFSMNNFLATVVRWHGPADSSDLQTEVRAAMSQMTVEAPPPAGDAE